MTFYNKSNSSESKIESKFYALQTKEYIRACLKLTEAQLNIFYYLKTLDPDGDGVDINIKELATKLGLSRQTVSKTLKVLGQLGWLELEKITVSHTISINPQVKNP